MTSAPAYRYPRKPWTAIVLAVLCGAAVAGTHATRPDEPLREEQHAPSAPRVVAPAPGADGDSPPTAAAPPAVGRTMPGGDVAGAPAVTAGGIPAVVFAAYQRAAALLATERPGCHLPAPLLAAIGKVESGHARGGRVDAFGTALQPILGPTLDGGFGLARIADTDGGRYDGDTTWDRAVGPMQFIPGTWVRWAQAGADPQNVNDAAVAAGRYLCADNRNLATDDGVRAGVLSYNRSEAYLRIVSTWFAVYRNSTLVLPATGASIPVVAAQSAPAPPLVPAPVGVSPAPPSSTPVPPPVPPTQTPAPPAPPAPVPPQLPVLITDPVTGLVCLVGGVLDLGGALLGGLLGVPVAPSTCE
jgi:hypothetical protein